MAVKVWERTIGALVILLVCLISTVSLADESYLCIGEHATGFAFNKSSKTWRTTDFMEEKWVIRKGKDNKTISKWEVHKFGEELIFPYAFCSMDFNEYGTLRCEGIDSDFRMNKNTMRYIRASFSGYWSEGIFKNNKELAKYNEEGASTPLIEVGKCSKI